MTDSVSACLLCASAPAVSREHVVPESLGGRRTVRGFICESCNNVLGATVDAALEQSLRPISLMTGAKRGDNRSVAKMDFDFDDGTRRALLPSGLADVPRSTKLLWGGEPITQVRRPELERIAQIVASRARREGLSADELSISIEPAEQTTESSARFQLDFGTEPHYRSVLKMGLAAAARRGWAVTALGHLDDMTAFVNGYTDGTPIRTAMDADNFVAFRTALRVEPGVHTLFVGDILGKLEVVFLAFGFVMFRVRTPFSCQRARAVVHIVDPYGKQHVIREHEGDLKLPFEPGGPGSAATTLLFEELFQWAGARFSRLQAGSLALLRGEAAIELVFQELRRAGHEYLTEDMIPEIVSRLTNAVILDTDAPISTPPDVDELREAIRKLL